MFNADLNIISIIVIVIYSILCIVKKINYKITFYISIFYILVAAVFLLFENEYMAINISSIAYYLLIAAVILAIVEFYRENTNKKKEKKLTDSD